VAKLDGVVTLKVEDNGGPYVSFRRNVILGEQIQAWLCEKLPN
jgi:hypothetical protein